MPRLGPAASHGTRGSSASDASAGLVLRYAPAESAAYPALARLEVALFEWSSERIGPL